MASRLKRTWNRLLRRHPSRKLLTPQPSETKGFFPGRDSLAIHSRDDRRRPLTAMAMYETPETPVGGQPFAFADQSSPASRASMGLLPAPVRGFKANGIDHANATGSPSLARSRNRSTAPETPVRITFGAIVAGSNQPAPVDSLCESDAASGDEVVADSGSERSMALTTATSSTSDLSPHVENLTPTTSPLAADGKASPVFVDEKIPVMSEPAMVSESCVSPVMRATSGPLQDYFVYYAL